MAAGVLYYIFVVVSVCVQHVSGDYQCVCNYNIETGVMSSPSDQGTPIGYMYEFDCKASIASLSTDQWLAIAFEHKVGYIPRDPQAQQQICQGEVPPDDKVTTTTVATSPTPTTTPVQTTPSTTSTTVQPTTTPTTTTPTTTTPTTTTSPTTTMTTTTPTTTTPKPTTSSTATPMPTTPTTVATTNPTTPMPTTTVVATTTTPTSTATPQATQTTQSISTSTAYVVSGKPDLCPAQLRSRVQSAATILTQYGESCYEIESNKRATWDIAETHCKTNGGQLVTIESQGEQTFITNFLRHNFYHNVWIGLNDKKHESMFEWSSGTNVSFTNWHLSTVVPDPLSIGATEEDCGVLVPSSNGLWDDMYCQFEEFYICEYGLQEVTTPSGNPNSCAASIQNHVNQAGSLLTQYGDMCYETVTNQLLPWTSAEYYCNRNGGHLVTIKDAAEQSFIYGYLNQNGGQPVWIGLSDSEVEGHFQWSSGTPYVYEHWYQEIFNFQYSFEDCAVLTFSHSGKWDDRRCDATHYFMCEYNSDGSSSVTSTTTPSTTTALPHVIDPSGITAPGDVRQCPSTIASLAIRDNADLGYYQNSCYEFIPRAVNYQHALSLCQSRNGELVDILTAKEQQFVKAFLQIYSPQHAVWTGLHDRNHENQFEWTSGATVKYTNWVPHHEDNFVSHNQEDCVLIVPYQYGQWDDVPCGGYGFFGGDSGEVHPLLCEYKLSHYLANAIIG